ncbi:2-hydroxyacid dehydrogenase like protein [Zymoseptoria brevis]|uniref:2-hydroxyacid dehydrogenase like protein n=1 Tax=Zymoseptoria brevis TaxID=1047168 RepID=A0A0F4G795_9PEZI|nr:2-hydroxyacid dehydrogenase like protein [Zymoseptoria brevis]
MGGGEIKDHLLCLLPFPEPTAILSALRSRFPDLEITYVDVSSSPEISASEIPPHLWSRTTLLCTITTFPASVASVPNLDLVHLISAGANQIFPQPIWTDSQVTITTSSGIHGPQIAEWVVMTGLVASHGYRELYELQKRRVWGDENGEYRKVSDRVGKRVGILGYGSIGRQVGRVAKAMGMEVLAYTAGEKDTEEKKRDQGWVVPGTGDREGKIPLSWWSGLDKASLHTFLKQDLDWLVICVPLTPQTLHFLGADELRILGDGGKKPAYVTNIARGPILQTEALIEAIKKGWVSGAALDVTDPEPLPEGSELWGMKEVILTPHVSGSGEAYVGRTFEVLGENLERRTKGKRLINVVERGRGY